MNEIIETFTALEITGETPKVECLIKKTTMAETLLSNLTITRSILTSLVLLFLASEIFSGQCLTLALVHKVYKDVTVNNIVFVKNITTIFNTEKFLCSHQCEHITKGKANLVKYNAPKEQCDCLEATPGFRDPTGVAPSTDGVVFKAER